MPSSETTSAWAPFRHRLFAAMWSAQFVSNIGGWMQTVAAQWLMLSLTTSAVYVTLVQTAAGLPVVLFADRRVAFPRPGAGRAAARARLSPGAMLAAGSFGLAAVALVLAFAHAPVAVALALVVGGIGWILALSTLNSLYQLSLPQWIKARGMSFYLVCSRGATRSAAPSWVSWPGPPG